MATVRFTAATLKSMMANENTPNIKQYFEVDAEGDITAIYQAQAAASGGETCLKQIFEYAVTASGLKYIQKIKWDTYATWSGAAWDIT